MIFQHGFICKHFIYPQSASPRGQPQPHVFFSRAKHQGRRALSVKLGPRSRAGLQKQTYYIGKMSMPKNKDVAGKKVNMIILSRSLIHHFWQLLITRNPVIPMFFWLNHICSGYGYIGLHPPWFMVHSQFLHL